MLTSLYIENIAVIEKTSIDFTQGLNALTGETGAGKSIVIDAINAILGARTSKDIIRNGAETAFISATFENISGKSLALLKEYGCESDENLYIIQREISLNGKNTCRINGRPVPLNILKLITEQLIHIHGQHDNGELRTPETHISYIDSFNNINKTLVKYKTVYHEFKKIESELYAADISDAEREHEKDLLSFQINEIDDADLSIDELETLNQKKTVLLNSEKIVSALSEAKDSLSGNDDFIGTISSLKNAYNSLLSAARYHEISAQLASRLGDSVYELEDCSLEISNALEQIESDPNELQLIEERLDLIYKLLRKYGENIDDILDYRDNAAEKLERLVKYEYNREQLQKQYQIKKNEAELLSSELSAERKKTSDWFAKRVKEEMTFLDMPNVTLVVNFEPCELYELGAEKIELLISTNPGEPPKPVSKIASGGELSRMMLAIKNVLSEEDDIDTLIFDEIDTGISGSAAAKVGMKLKEVSKNRQVICVTHQAQIAALATTHFKIIKNVANGRTFTNIESLNFEGRKQELARILGGVNITELTLKHAEEMLKSIEISGV
ncbi:MAG: DNA repair protein RecN [Bacillota bacterium]|nr:DNA repair protein RecN [Bacillota bacterium]